MTANIPFSAYTGKKIFLPAPKAKAGQPTDMPDAEGTLQVSRLAIDFVTTATVLVYWNALVTDPEMN